MTIHNPRSILHCPTGIQKRLVQSHTFKPNRKDHEGGIVAWQGDDLAKGENGDGWKVERERTRLEILPSCIVDLKYCLFVVQDDWRYRGCGGSSK